MKVIGYTRVSTSEQGESGLGLAAQREQIRDWAVRRDAELVQIYEDPGASGKSLNRPEVTKALELLDRGQADALVVAKLDRLSRSLADFTRLMERAAKKHWSLVALDLGVDTTTPAGEMIANSVANFSQFERRLIGQRTKDALAIKRRQGVKLGRPTAMPSGVAELIVTMRAEGVSIRKIADQLTADGVPTAHGGARWHASTVQKVLAGRR